MERDISQTRLITLAVLESISVIAVSALVVGFVWRSSELPGGWRMVPLVATGLAMTFMALAALALITFGNCCEFNRAVPLGGGCNC